MTSRRREITWHDPAPLGDRARAMAGIDFLRAIADGSLPCPPIMDLIGFRPVEVEEGRVLFEGRADESHYNPIGGVHGGIFATLLDSAASCAVHTTLPLGEGYVTLELKTNFLRGITLDSGVLRCEGKVVHRGRTTGLADAQLFDGKGRLCGHATATCLIMRHG